MRRKWNYHHLCVGKYQQPCHTQHNLSSTVEQVVVALFPGGSHAFCSSADAVKCYLGCVRVVNFGWTCCMRLGTAPWRGQWRVRPALMSYERFFLVGAAERRLPVQSGDFCMVGWCFLIRTGRLMKKKYWKSSLEIFYYTELRISLWRGGVLGQEVDLVVSYFLPIFLELMMSKMNLFCRIWTCTTQQEEKKYWGHVWEDVLVFVC